MWVWSTVVYSLRPQGGHMTRYVTRQMPCYKHHIGNTNLIAWARIVPKQSKTIYIRSLIVYEHFQQIHSTCYEKLTFVLGQNKGWGDKQGELGYPLCNNPIICECPSSDDSSEYHTMIIMAAIADPLLHGIWCCSKGLARPLDDRRTVISTYIL